MARKHKHEEHVNHERWLVSYADFITLLFATFTALFAISNRDMEKFKKLAASIKEAFGGSGAIIEMPGVSSSGGADPNAALVINITPAITPAAGQGAGDNAGEHGQDKTEEKPQEVFDGTTNLKAQEPGEEPPEDQQGVTKASGVVPIIRNEPTPIPSEPTPTPTPTPELTPTPTPTPEPTPTPTPPGKTGDLPVGSPDGGSDPMLADEIKQLIDSAGLKGKVDVRQEQRGMVISLGEAAFFSTGSVDVHPESSHQLDKIVNLLRGKNLEIRVEGHTDNTPVRSGRFKSNLELSTLRAARIVEFMITEYKFSPDRLSSAGYGEFRPISDNDTDAGRSKNRRVDIVILNRGAAQLEPHPEAAPAVSAQAPALPAGHS